MPHQYTPNLGDLPSEDARRDCIHVAVYPGTAACFLRPGDRVGFAKHRERGDFSVATDEVIGVVDPFLTRDVAPGDRFWLMLFPDSISGLRHVWTSPHFKAKRLEDI